MKAWVIKRGDDEYVQWDDGYTNSGYGPLCTARLFRTKKEAKENLVIGSEEHVVKVEIRGIS